MAHWKVNKIRLCYEKCWPNLLSEATFSRTNFWFIIFSVLLHKILALVFNMFIYHMRRLAIQNSLKCTGTLQIFIDPHWYFILDTGLILRSIELFIYIQTNVSVPEMRAFGWPEFFFFTSKKLVTGTNGGPKVKSDITMKKWF